MVNKPRDKDSAREFWAQIFGQRITSMQIHLASRFIQSFTCNDEMYER